MAKSYEEAVKTLNTLQSNAATIEKIRSTQDRNRHQSIPETIEMAARVGITLDDVDGLSVIHVSGTKGKGSTCAFCENILRQHGFKTGFFSSPHLIEVRERIRINGRPLTRDDFSKYFWDCYHPLEQSKATHNDSMPPYFRFLTILACHVFLQEKVDVAIMEVGIGGEYDCTNIVKNPIVCGVTSLGLDHTSILGDTIEKIAWHKAGIFKSLVPAVTVVPQPEASMFVLQERAKEIGCPLYLAPSLDSYDWNKHKIDLGIPGIQQISNATLALQLCNIWIRDHNLSIKERQSLYTTDAEKLDDCFAISTEMAAGLQSCQWPGRSQKISGPGITYYLDGAHTDQSLKLCAEWFESEANMESKSLGNCKVARVLLFNTTGDRNPENLLRNLVDCKFDCAIFCPNIQKVSSEKSADLTNFMVSMDSQLRRCAENRNAWLELLYKQRHDNITRLQRHDNITRLQCHDNIIPLSNTKAVQHEERLFQKNERTGECIDALFPMPTFTLNTILDGLTWVSRDHDPRLACDDGRTVVGMPACLANAQHVQVLCTGSLHLIGGILGLLDPTICDDG